MKYLKYHARYPKGAYWYPIGTLIFKCVDVLNIRPWSYDREIPFPEYKTMVFNLVQKLSTHEGQFSNIRPGLINGKNR